MFKLTSKAQQQVDFSKVVLDNAGCSKEDYDKAIVEIFSQDLSDQLEALIDKGFTPCGALDHINGLDKGAKVL